MGRIYSGYEIGGRTIHPLSELEAYSLLAWLNESFVFEMRFGFVETIEPISGLLPQPEILIKKALGATRPSCR